MADRVIVEILVAAPIETVWKAVLQSVEAQRWFGWDYPNLATDLVEMWKDAHSDVGEARDLRPTTCRTGSRSRISGPTRSCASSGRRRPVTPAGRGSTTTWSKAGSRSCTSSGSRWSGHPAENRRTLFLNGRAKDAGTPHPAEALGLSPLWVVLTGEQYEVTVATGDRLTGTVSLLVLLSRWDSPWTASATAWSSFRSDPKRRSRPTAAVRSSSRPTEWPTPEFAQLRERWSQWWTKTYEVIEIQP